MLRPVFAAAALALFACKSAETPTPPTSSATPSALVSAPSSSSSPATQTASAPAVMSPRPKSVRELVDATVAAIRSNAPADVALLTVSREDIAAVCTGNGGERATRKLEKATTKLESSVAACNRLLGGGPIAVGDVQGGEERDVDRSCPGVRPLRDVKVRVTAGGERYRITLDDPVRLEGRGYALTQPLECSADK